MQEYVIDNGKNDFVEFMHDGQQMCLKFDYLSYTSKFDYLSTPLNLIICLHL